MLLAGVAVRETRINHRLRVSEGKVREGTVEERLLNESQLLAQATDAIVALDLDYRITFWNLAAEELFGWSSAVVEDQDQVGAYVERVLSGAGFVVLRAGGMAEAEEIAAANEIDLLLTDVVMPNGNGPQLARKLQQRRPDLRVVYTSGYTENVIVHKGMLDKGVSYIPKPFKADVLVQRVTEELGRSA